MVQQPISPRCCQHCSAEQGAPLGTARVPRYHDGSFLVAGSDDCKERVGLSRRQLAGADLVDDEDLRSDGALQAPRRRAAWCAWSCSRLPLSRPRAVLTRRAAGGASRGASPPTTDPKASSSLQRDEACHASPHQVPDLAITIAASGAICPLSGILATTARSNQALDLRMTMSKKGASRSHG
jgi:hypothetical protein